VSELGVVHSTGYPPYLLLGHVFASLDPFGSPATSANLWSAVAAAAAVALVARYVLVATGSVAGAVVAAALLALGPMFWFQATVASVYPLLAFAVALLLNAAHAWWHEPSSRRLALLAFSIGLVALAHTGGLAFSGAGVVLIALRARRVLRGRRDVLALAAVAIPFLALVYIPLRSGYAGFPNRGGISVFDMVFGGTGTFSGDTPGTASRYGLAAHAWSTVVLLLASLSPALLVLVPLGVRRLLREVPYLLCCLAPAVAASAVVVTMASGYAYWHLPLLVAGAVACGAGVEPLLGWLRRSPAPRRVLAGGALALALLVAPVAGVLYLANSHRDASDWSRATLEALPRGAQVVAPWIAYAPMRAEQTINGVRRDVDVELTFTGTPVDIEELRGDYEFAVAIGADPPSTPGAVRVGPESGANFKGLSGLRAGPFKIGFESTAARTYQLSE
jgi:4-amino-4-deoxy-L-arabinose transferase-like glycosyltransferase